MKELNEINIDSGSKFIFTIKFALNVFFFNWLLIIAQTCIKIILAFTRLSPIQIIYLFITLVMLISSLFPWILYNINFIGLNIEQSSSSSLRWFFFFISALYLFFIFFDLPYRRYILLTIFLITAFIYLFAIIKTNSIHTSMEETDYHYSVAIYFYGVSLFFTFLLSLYSFSSPVFKIERCKSYWLDTV